MPRSNAMPVETAAEFPTFCRRCGRRLVVEERTDGFSARTGAPRLVAYAYCPGSRLSRFRGDDPHESYVVSPRPPVSPMPPMPRRPNPTELSR